MTRILKKTKIGNEVKAKIKSEARNVGIFIPARTRKIVLQPVTKRMAVVKKDCF